MLDSFSDGSFVEWIAKNNDTIIATSSVSFYKLPPNAMRPTSKIAYIGNMFTIPEYRKLGIGTKLLALSVEEAKEKGCKEIRLDASDRGRSLYGKYGFKDSEDAMIYLIE